MRSYLTRRVFRHILRNRPIVHRDCIRGLSRIASQPTKPTPTSHSSSSPQQRSIWWGWLTGQPKRVLKPKKLDPGIEIMEEQKILLSRSERKYSDSALVDAFRDFFQHTMAIKRPILDTQITAVLATYKHLLLAKEYDTLTKLTIEETLAALGQLNADPAFDKLTKESNLDALKEMADLMFEDIKSRESEWSAEAEDDVQASGAEAPPAAGTVPEVSFLSRSAKKYLEVLAFRVKDDVATRDAYLTLVKEYPELVKNVELPGLVARVLAYNKNDKGLTSFLELLNLNESALPDHIWQSIIRGAILIEDMEAIKKWYRVRPTPKDHPEFHLKLDIGVLRLCITTENMAWGQPLLNELVERKYPTRKWRANQMAMILTWAMASGRSVDDLDKMMDLLASRLEISPDVEAMNAVVEMSKIKKDPYYAERLFSLMKQKNIPYNGTTYKLEMDWRLLAGDISGAQVSYNRLQGQEFHRGEISPAVNQLILALIAKDPIPYEEVMDMVAELVDIGGTFSAELVAELTRLHLQRGELHDLADLLHTHAAFFTAAERSIVRDTLSSFISQAESSGDKWDAYVILKAIFPELRNNIRLDIMQQFFKLQRHDLGMHVFVHMREADLKEYRPDAKAYAQFYEGLASNRDAEALEVAHNMLRLDLEVEPDTAINTSLMLAYIMIDRPGRAIGIWDEISVSREGPSFDAINVALRACQEYYKGLKYATEIWTQLQKQNVDIPKETADSYIAALTAQGEIDEAISLVSQFDKLSNGFFKADALTVVAVINLSIDEQREQALDWARQKYPEEFKAIEAGGTSPHGRRFRPHSHLPADGSYKCRWNEIGLEDWQMEYVDWKKVMEELENSD